MCLKTYSTPAPFASPQQPFAASRPSLKGKGMKYSVDQTSHRALKGAHMLPAPAESYLDVITAVSDWSPCPSLFAVRRIGGLLLHALQCV